MKKIIVLKTFFLVLLLCSLIAGFVSCVSRTAAQAEEYFTIGMAFFELGRFTDAELWLNRARTMDRTMIATEYNLGRIAFETGRYEEAVRYFERLLVEDPDNIMVLKAAAFSRIKNGDLERAEALYDRVLSLIPESADDGFNYALVLYALEKYEEAETVLNNYPFALEERSASILLFARIQKAMEKVEAIDSYAKWLILSEDEPPNPQGLFEYALVLESAGHYARALERYDEAMAAFALTRHTGELRQSTVRFEKARLLLTVDPENDEGLREFNLSVTDGFADTLAIEALLLDNRLTQSNRTEIQRVLTDILISLQESETIDEEL